MADTPLQNFLADQRHLLDRAARTADLKDAVAVSADIYLHPLKKAAVRGPVLPLDGVLVRDWDRDFPETSSGLRFGIRLYTLEGIRFATVDADFEDSMRHGLREILIVGRADYAKLFRLGKRLAKVDNSGSLAPVLTDAVKDTLWRNTIGYLEPRNLERIRAFGARPKRGLLLHGSPGNGKSSVCRWLWKECQDRDWEWRLVTAEAYMAARQSCNPSQAIQALFTVSKAGCVFFDDLDQALRDREDSPATDDQSIFLNALDGIRSNEGAVYLFATNCPLDRIDPAFRRPGRIDVVVSFPKPDRALRGSLFDRWHADIQAALDRTRCVEDTEGMSFAEIEEIKNLLVLRFVDSASWDWPAAMEEFRRNREELDNRGRGPLGFLGSASSEDRSRKSIPNIAG